MDKDMIITVIADSIEDTARHNDDRFEEGANFYLWKIAWALGVQQDVEDELYFRAEAPS